MKIYVFDGLNDALLRIINEEMTECDIISIIVGDCENTKRKIKDITDKSTEEDVMDATSDNPFDIELKVRFSQMAIHSALLVLSTSTKKSMDFITFIRQLYTKQFRIS